MSDNNTQLTLVINTSSAAKVVEIIYNGVADSIHLMSKGRAHLPTGAVVNPNYAVLNSSYLKIYLPNTVPTVDVVKDTIISPDSSSSTSNSALLSNASK